MWSSAWYSCGPLEFGALAWPVANLRTLAPCHSVVAIMEQFDVTTGAELVKAEHFGTIVAHVVGVIGDSHVCSFRCV